LAKFNRTPGSVATGTPIMPDGRVRSWQGRASARLSVKVHLPDTLALAANQRATASDGQFAQLRGHRAFMGVLWLAAAMDWIRR